MTMHAAKGLEFPVVFLPGFEDGIFPGCRRCSTLRSWKRIGASLLCSDHPG